MLPVAPPSTTRKVFAARMEQEHDRNLGEREIEDKGGDWDAGHGNREEGKK